MGESELKIALQREGEARIRGFWQDAEAAVSARRKEIDGQCAQLRTESDQRLHAESTLLRNSLLFAAQNRALESRLHAEAALEKRLLQLARQLLPTLANNERSSLWRALHDELPKAEWTTFTVHPADRQLAERLLPAATIECDEALGGGLIAISTDGTIRIDNSLSCRLLRAWPDLLPQLLSDLRKQVDKHEAADTEKTG